jgi:hypothetical protein
MGKVNGRRTTVDGRRTPSNGKCSPCLWQGELKMVGNVTSHQYVGVLYLKHICRIWRALFSIYLWP